ncbi:MAG: methionine biosynthesis protein MetW [Pseudomonadota bacterium]|nr:methionine biosynthesis protein MetW [Pseudomonadota bacterium]
MIPHSNQIPDWITRHTRVLDLGCGNGELLTQLVKSHQVDALGLELDPEKVATCLDQGLSVIQQNLNSGLSNFNDQQFDTVIMTQTLQAIRRPDLALSEMLRVGREAIVTFPNFAHIRNRMQLGLAGHMPVNPQLPNPWYDTPNIHLSTFHDFEELCRARSIRILDRDTSSLSGKRTWLGKVWPNLFGEVALYRLTKES